MSITQTNLINRPTDKVIPLQYIPEHLIAEGMKITNENCQ